MVKTYKICYWLAGNIKVIKIKAKNLNEALVYFYENYPCDGVKDVQVVEDTNSVE